MNDKERLQVAQLLDELIARQTSPLYQLIYDELFPEETIWRWTPESYLEHFGDNQFSLAKSLTIKGEENSVGIMWGMWLIRTYPIVSFENNCFKIKNSEEVNEDE